MLDSLKVSLNGKSAEIRFILNFSSVNDRIIFLAGPLIKVSYRKMIAFLLINLTQGTAI